MRTPGSTPSRDPWLLTPGPLTTSLSVKQAMLHDMGTRDPAFIALNQRVRGRLVDLVNGGEEFVCVPLQGSGTFVVEGMLGTLVPPEGELLVLVNGAYGQRMIDMCKVMGRRVQSLSWPEDQPVAAARVAEQLARQPRITHVAVVHCETTSGVLNPVAEVAAVVARSGRRLLVDAMSAFGALPLDVTRVACDAVAASSNKCLEGVPGMGFCLVKRSALLEARGNAHSLSLDLADQWQAMEGNGQWRFTPPVHCLLAFDQALNEFEAEGGVNGRGRRYRHNCQTLARGMRELGFETLLCEQFQAPIIMTFHMPGDPAFDFSKFYDGMAKRGFLIYPGKLTMAESFRMGCSGHLGQAEIEAALAAVQSCLNELGVRSGAPAR